MVQNLTMRSFLLMEEAKNTENAEKEMNRRFNSKNPCEGKKNHGKTGIFHYFEKIIITMIVLLLLSFPMRLQSK